MKFSKITLAAAALVLAMGAKAQNSDPIKIGFITDMSGAYADIDGAAGAEVVKWAVSDFGGKLLGRPIEVLTSDHQNKPDVASVTAREWMDKEKLQMLIGGTNSAALLAMSRISAERSIPSWPPARAPPGSRTRNATPTRSIIPPSIPAP